MNSGHLSEYFTGVGTKVLTRVDATAKSNQHEIGDGNRGEVLMIHVRSKLIEAQSGDCIIKATQ